MKTAVRFFCVLFLCALAACNASNAITDPAGGATPAVATSHAEEASASVQPPQEGAGADCGKAKGGVEISICKDPGLVRLDGQMAAAYATALAAVEPSGKPQLRQEQTRWLRHTRDLCLDAPCLKQVYAERIATLAGGDKVLVNEVSCETPAGSAACVNVVVFRDPNDRIDAFNRLLAEERKSGKIVGCRALIDLPAGTAGGNHRFGAYCVLQEESKRTDIKLCNDEMVGNFAIEPAAPDSEAVKELIDFTNDRCAEA